MGIQQTYRRIAIVLIPVLAVGILSQSLTTNVLPSPVLPHGKMRGITLVAPPSPIDSSAFIRLRQLGTDWIALIPYGFTRKGEGSVHYNSDRQWWGERAEGIEACIQMAREQQIKIMLKPQIWMSGGWIGELDFGSDGLWLQWEKDYKAYIMTYVDLAIKHDVEIFCIGTEINRSIEKRPQFWRQLIKEIRSKYKGKLTYSANWDHYEKVSLWDDLDYVGISSYFPLSDDAMPTPKVLHQSWQKVTKKLNRFSAKHDKPILFTEYGYLAVDGCAGKTWELEDQLDRLPINLEAQANAYDALWLSMHNQEAWAGGFLWKWYPAGKGHEGYPHKDYTPQDKPAEAIIKKWFSER
jgi:hypothetical protein